MIKQNEKNLQERTYINDTKKGKLCNRSNRILMKVEYYMKTKEYNENVTEGKITNL